MFPKTCTFLYFYIFSLTCSVFLTLSLLLPLPHIFPSVDPRFCKSYLQSKTFNIAAAPSSAIFYSNAVLITLSSSMQFFSFFNVQPSVLTITGMALMLLMFHILLIPVFNSWYLNFFLLFLANSPGIAVSIMAQLLSFLFTRTVYGFLALISLSHWIITSSKIHFQQHLDHVQTIFHFFFRLCFPHNFQLFLQHHVFPCTCFMPTFPILSQYQISFHFSRHTFYKVVIGLFYLSCVSYSLFKLPVVAQQTR